MKSFNSPISSFHFDVQHLIWKWENKPTRETSIIGIRQLLTLKIDGN